ncbi:glycoside hydrolase family 3 N-terminal domain-containing protein [Cyanobium sp. CH-040]|uniref:glycoside hydrolase family 3 N-terminal domain-containing protein n=1 Tax=Cyanobium sp. CH-040 TaxID=2823708 RepID=UPI0020CBCB14|nr:glycoside hydrolase family 3 N-terminal domain-containing protein [Cyanobium sp. CH-040]MCP9928998.1 glycosyl hydrolase family 3 [Cyanobium sp. CH-040]
MTSGAAARADAALSDGSLRRLIAELIVVRASGHLSDGQRRYPRWELTNRDLQHLLQEGVGGVILLGGSAPELALRTRQLQTWAGRTLLLCADVEEGVGQRFEGASWLVPPLALGRLHGRAPQRALALAEAYGRCTARDARAVGLNWVLGPVCDVNNNPANPVINVRAWGEDPATAGALAAAFIRGLQAKGVLGCAKHFPGHGDTSGDSHLELPLLGHDRARLEAVELPPFRSAIAAGVAAVMTAHLSLPALDPQRPATLSPLVLTGLLRGELGFDGLVVTDALVMEAIAAHHGAGEATVLALEAGADLVLMPADAHAAITAIAAAVASGRLSRERLEASARRRRTALASLPEQGRTEADPWQATSPDLELGRELVVATLEARGRVRPLPAGDAGVNLIRVDQALHAPFLPATAPALSAAAAAGFRPCLLAGDTASLWSGDTEAPLHLERLAEGPVLVQLFVRGNPFRGHAADQEPWPAALRQLLRAGRLAGLAVYGSPYLWQQLLPVLPPEVPAAYSPGQMPLAQHAVLTALGVERSDRGGFTD